MKHIWYKNAIFYSLDVETFYDANGDGTGDFQGLINKLDYISGLGVNCIWLLPFFPSPNRDNGYDVTDYYNIDPRLGSLGDFAEFMDKASQLGIRVVIDLVVNHTSIKHPWFKEASGNPDSKYFNYYIWSDKPQKHNPDDLILKGEVDKLWTYNEKAGKYYLHRFYEEQPDLNIANRDVRLEILKVMGFWLRLGVSGFRVDAAEILIEPYGLSTKEEYNLSGFLEEMREFISLRNSDAILVAEANVLPRKLKTYLDKGQRMHMVFNFFLNQHLFLAMAEEKSAALYQALKQLPKLSHQNQWLNFLRHHDELSLELLTEKQREKIYQKFAPDMDMLIFDTGIRRRIAPMLEGDKNFMRLAFSLLFSLPGVAMIRYGDEIGMGENLRLKGRESVRTPMQWSEAVEAGFSSEGKNTNAPIITDEKFGYQTLNIRKQQRGPTSFLNWIEQLIIARKHFPEIGNGEYATITTDEPGLFIHCFTYYEEGAYFIHNLASHRVSIKLKSLDIETAFLSEIFGDDLSRQQDGDIILAPYGFKWFKYTKQNPA